MRNLKTAWHGAKRLGPLVPIRFKASVLVANEEKYKALQGMADRHEATGEYTVTRDTSTDKRNVLDRKTLTFMYKLQKYFTVEIVKNV